MITATKSWKSTGRAFRVSGMSAKPENTTCRTLTSSPVGFRASPCHSPVKCAEKTTNDGYGQSLLGSFASYDHATRSWKTSQACLFTEWEAFSETWPRAGTMRSGTCYPLHRLALRISETDCLLLPTPTTGGLDGGSNSRRANRRRGILPTPTVSGNRNFAGSSKKAGDGLQTVIGGPLNPPFVEWMMGFPIGHTDLEP